MEHTKGKLRVQGAKPNEAYGNQLYYAFVGIESISTIGFYYPYSKLEEKERDANANLIIDAFNTTNESGLTPSQLYKQNQELLEALNECAYWIFHNNGENSNVLKEAQQAINNAKTK